MMPLDLFRAHAFRQRQCPDAAALFRAQRRLVLPADGADRGASLFSRRGGLHLPALHHRRALSRLGGAMADRFGVRMLHAVKITARSSFVLLVPAVFHGSYWLAVAPVTSHGARHGITVAPLSTTVMNAAASDRIGVASGINNAISRVATRRRRRPGGRRDVRLPTGRRLGPGPDMAESFAWRPSGRRPPPTSLPRHPARWALLCDSHDRRIRTGGLDLLSRRRFERLFRLSLGAPGHRGADSVPIRKAPAFGRG